MTTYEEQVTRGPHYDVDATMTVPEVLHLSKHIFYI